MFRYVDWPKDLDRGPAGLYPKTSHFSAVPREALSHSFGPRQHFLRRLCFRDIWILLPVDSRPSISEPFGWSLARRNSSSLTCCSLSSRNSLMMDSTTLRADSTLVPA